jgi:hypothetical protein
MEERERERVHVERGRVVGRTTTTVPLEDEDGLSSMAVTRSAPLA